MYQNDAMKVLTGEVRLSYANLTTPRAAQQGGEPKYSVTLLIPKSDAATKADIDAAIQAAANEAMDKVWNGARPPMLKVPIYDGDGVRPSGVPFGDECKGHWVMTASTKNKPQVVGIDTITCELSPGTFPAACMAVSPSVSSATPTAATRALAAVWAMFSRPVTGSP